MRRSYDAVSYAYRTDEVDEAAERQYASWVGLLDPILPRGGSVLELGCGCGLPATRMLVANHRVTGIDMSPVQIERARALVPQADFHCCDMVSFPLLPGTYDGIVSFYAIIHVPVAEQAPLFQRVAQALRPGSVLLFTVGHHEWTGTEADWLGVAGATMYWSHECEATYRRWMTEAGLDVRSCEFIPEGESGHSLILATKPGRWCAEW